MNEKAFWQEEVQPGVKPVNGYFLESSSLHISGSLNTNLHSALHPSTISSCMNGDNNNKSFTKQQRSAVGDADTVDIPHFQQNPFWEDLEPFQPVTAKAYWRKSDVPYSESMMKTPRAMWKRPLHPDPNAPENEWLPEVDVVLQLADVHISDAYAMSGRGPLHGIWATTNSSQSRVIDQHGNVQTENLLLYPPGVMPSTKEDEDTPVIVARGTWTLPAGKKAEWPPLTEAAKRYKANKRFEWQNKESSSWTPQVAKVYTNLALVGGKNSSSIANEEDCTVGVWKFDNNGNDDSIISELELLPTVEVTIHPMTDDATLGSQPSSSTTTWGVWCINPHVQQQQQENNNGAGHHHQYKPEDIWFFPPHTTPKPAEMVPKGKWTFNNNNNNNLNWPPWTQQAKRKRLGNLPQWPQQEIANNNTDGKKKKKNKKQEIIIPKTATVYSEQADLTQHKAANLQGIWKIITGFDEATIWDPQYVLVYPQEANLLDDIGSSSTTTTSTTIPHGLWGINGNATPKSDGSWEAQNVWFLEPGASHWENFIPCGQWAYSPTKQNATWPPMSISSSTTTTTTTYSIKKKTAVPPVSPPSNKADLLAASNDLEEGKEAPIQVPKKPDTTESTAPATPRRRQEEKEEATAEETTGISSPNFFARNTAAAAALRKKRELEKRYSNTSLQEMAEATRQRRSINKSSPSGSGAGSSRALLKTRILERRYSSTSHREISRATLKSLEAASNRYSSNETLRLSENTMSMLEASSALIASVVPKSSSPMPMLPPPIVESPAIVTTRKNTTTTTTSTTEPSVSNKVQLMESLLAEQGSLLVLCTESPDSRTMSLDQDNALLLCYDVPDYEILYMENEPTLGQELLQVSRKSIYPQFFFEPYDDDNNDDRDDELLKGNDDTDKKEQRTKYIYLGGFATVRAMLAERMSFQYRTSEKEERRKSKRPPERSKSLDL